MKDLEEILSNLKIDPINIYMYGSRVYKTHSEDSDYDFIVVSNSFSENQYVSKRININFYTVSEFEHKIQDHSIDALECLFLDKKFILKKDMDFYVKIDLKKLRSSLCKISSNSWVKCKKKLTIDKDYAPIVAKKSLFHSFRIIYFGIDLAKNHRITNYQQCNDLFKEIMSQPDDWIYLKDLYQKKHNNLLSDFRKLAPK